MFMCPNCGVHWTSRECGPCHSCPVCHERFVETARGLGPLSLPEPPANRTVSDSGCLPVLAAIVALTLLALVVLVLAAGCYDPCRTQSDEQYRYHERGTRNPELGTDPAGCQNAAPGQKQSGPTASRRPTRAAEDAAILPANPPVQSAVTVPSSAFRVSRLLAAIRQVESSNRPDPPDRDQGRSIGPYQIQRKYWIDAGVPWPYQAVRSEREGRLTVLAYWRRRAPSALATGDLETLARLHNGGPDWAAKPATLDYWRRILAVFPAVRFTAENAENQEAGRAIRHRDPRA